MALIFAVFLTNPSPICVLDEVDAPLDDANVDRFCTLMEKMSADTATRFLGHYSSPHDHVAHEPAVRGDDGGEGRQPARVRRSRNGAEVHRGSVGAGDTPLSPDCEEEWGEETMDVLVDLDGTWSTPSPKCWARSSMRCDSLGAPVPPIDELAWADRAGFERHRSPAARPADRTEEAVSLYRESYSRGAMYDAVVYPGVSAALDALGSAGCRLFVATAKAHHYARPILEHFDLVRHFAGHSRPGAGRHQ